MNASIFPGESTPSKAIGNITINKLNELMAKAMQS